MSLPVVAARPLPVTGVASPFAARAGRAVAAAGAGR